jgi:iron(III) transport system ATP-binding protein
LREELIESLGKVMRETRITTLLVTHHQEDAFDLSDKLGVLNQTHLEQWGSPYDLYHNPKTRFVADFIGKGVFLNATFLGEGRVQTELGVFSDPALREVTFHRPCQLLVRPDDVIHDDAANLKARLIQKRFRGSMHLYTLELPSGNRVLSYVPSHHNHDIGEWIGIRVEMDHVNVYES